MKCAHCGTELVRATRGGDAMLHNRGMLIKDGALVFRCPTCKADVTPTADVMKSLQAVSILYFKAKASPTPLLKALK